MVETVRVFYLKKISQANIKILFFISCLDHSKWIFDDAANAFMQFKESIPKEAYLV